MKTIACLGSGSGTLGDPTYDAMVEVGYLLAEKGYTVITGGFGGAGMEAPARGTAVAGGKVIGYTMFGKPGNAFLSKSVDCGGFFVLPPDALFLRKLCPEEQYGIRLGNLLAADGFIIGAGGGPGTMVELMAIINLNNKYWVWKGKQKSVAILNVNNDDGNGWNTDMLDRLEVWSVLPQGVRERILVVSTPGLAVSWATT